MWKESSANGAQTTGYPHAENEVGQPYLTTHTSNLKLTRNLNIRAKTIELLEKTNKQTRRNLHDLGLCSDFLYMTLRAQGTNENKLYYIKI